MVTAFDRVRNPQKIQEGRCSKFITEGFIICRWPTGPRNPFPKSSVGNRPAENVLPNLLTSPVVPGSWAYEQRGQLNEEADCDSSCRCQEDSNDEKDSGSDMVAKGMMKVHAAH